MTQALYLVTGASGFVGRAVVARLHGEGALVRAASREFEPLRLCGVRYVSGLDLERADGWQAALNGVDIVIHCAALAHVRGGGRALMSRFRRVNVDGTRSLAIAAAAAGVRRYVFLSTIGVNGDETHGSAFTAADRPAPQSDYARSKWEGELALQEVGARTGLPWVVVRAPLVYGPNAPGNFGRLQRAVGRGTTLPFGGLSNLRSLVALDNLVDLLVLCAKHPDATGEIFLAADGEDLSTPQLIRCLGDAMDCPAQLAKVPVALIRGLLHLIGRSGIARSLCSSLQVDISKTREVLGWSPVINVREGLVRAVGGQGGRRVKQ